MSEALIHITQQSFIASGAFCDCYRHPDIPEQCIKIQTDNKKASKKLKMDLDYYKKLHSKQYDLQYIADYLGICQTNLGQGYVYECVLDGDGMVSKTLEYYLKHNNSDIELILKKLHQLAIHVLQNRIIISDIHSKNIVVQIVEGQSPKPVMVDGIGDRVFITIMNIFKAEVHAKIIRRWNRFIDKLLENHPELQPHVAQIYLSKKHIQS